MTMTSPLQQPHPNNNNSGGRRRQQVCLFGLSADPPTGMGGHFGIAQYLASSFSFDEVRILPVYQHMYSTKRNNQTSFHHRVQMCKLAFENDNYDDVVDSNSSRTKVVVSEAERTCFERHVENKNYLEEDQKQCIRIGTADLLDMLTTNEPHVEFTLALGSDTFIDLASGKWKRTEDVFRLLGHRLVVFCRKMRRRVEKEEELDHDGNQTNDSADSATDNDAAPLDEDEVLLQGLMAKWQIINPHTQSSSIQAVCIPTLTNVSSSVVRHSTDVKVLQDMVSQSVLDYIIEHKLYAFSEKEY